GRKVGVDQDFFRIPAAVSDIAVILSPASMNQMRPARSSLSSGAMALQPNTDAVSHPKVAALLAQPTIKPAAALTTCCQSRRPTAIGQFMACIQSTPLAHSSGTVSGYSGTI